MAIEKDLLDQLLAGRDSKELFAKNGLLDELRKAFSERILNAELDEHLEDERIDGNINRRNGTSKKTELTGTSKIELAMPRDGEGRFDPQLIAKYQRRFPDFDEKIISMYARGLSVREVRGHLEEIYGIEVSPDLISAITEALLEGVHSADVILNILARRRDPEPAITIMTPAALQLHHAPLANCDRYDQLRRLG